MSQEDDIINPLREIFKNVKEKESRWLTHRNKDGAEIAVECFGCGCEMPRKRRYCPDCGARMVNYDEEEG